MSQKLQDVFDNFSKLKVLIIGDVMIDSYLWGSVSRISPEAPVPIVDVKKREKRLGGAANVAQNIKALGATPILCTLVGDDDDGKVLDDLLAENNMSDAGLVVTSSRPTTIKHRIISNSQHMLRIDSESTAELAFEEQVLLKEKIDQLLPDCDVVLFEDYDKGSINEPIISYVVEKTNALGIPTIVDPKKRNFFSYQGVTLFKPNLKELKEGLKIDFDSKNIREITKATQVLKDRLNVGQALVTLSELGMILSTETNLIHKKAHLRSISDVSGAGDTVISVASLCLALGLNPEFLVDLSNLAGGLVCEYVGVVPIDKSQLLEEAKIHGLDQLL